MEKLIKALMEAPDWLRVRSATIETSEDSTTLTRDELEDFEFPVIAFRLTVEISPNRHD